ncbi:MAG: hypothetical protein WBR18_02085 [Anaerolineales bacterium]
MTRHLTILVAASGLLLSSLACETGQILTPEEATQAAVATGEARVGAAQQASNPDFEPGDLVTLTGQNFLIGLASEPGDTEMISHVSRGSQGTVKDARDVNGFAWYQVETEAGTGWVNGKFLKPEATASQGLEIGATAYLAGKQYLVPIVDVPGSKRMVAGQERGAEVTILDVSVVDGKNWYEIEAPTGKGWVVEDNLSAEPLE